MPMGSLTSRTIAIIIEAVDKASGVIKGTAQSIQGLEEAAKTAILPFAGIAAAGTAVIAATTLTSARTQELGLVVENLGKRAGKSEEELGRIEKGIQRLGITTQASRTIMSQMMGAQLDLGRATDIARAAQDLAVISMQDSSAAAQDLLYAITSLQPRVLRKYSIYVNLNDVYERTAENLGKNVEELTAVDKRTGMMNETLAAAAGFAGTYEAAMETAGKQLRSFTRYSQEAANQFGEYFLPFLGAGIELLTDLTKAYIGLDDRTQAVISGTVMYATVISTAMTATLAGVIAISKLTKALEALKLIMIGHPLFLIPTALAVVATAAIQSKVAFDEQKKSIMETATSVEEYKKGVSDLIPEVPKASGHVRGFAHDAMVAAKATAELTAEQEWNEKQEKSLADAIAAGYANWEKRKAIVQANARAMVEASEALSADMGKALASNVISLRDNIAAYEELEAKVITAHVDMTARTADYNKDIKRMGEDRTKALSDLQEKQAEEIWRIEAGAHARSFEENEKALEWQRGIHAQELADFNTLWDQKESRRTEDFELASQQAWAVAEERRKAEEDARQAEMEAIKAAQEERLTLFALEMAEQAGMLQIPIKGWEDVSLSAQDYYDLTAAGIIPVSETVRNFMGTALEDLTGLWEGLGESGQRTQNIWSAIIEQTVPDVMDLGATGEEAAENIETGFDTRVLRALFDTSEKITENDLAMVGLAKTTTEKTSLMQTGIAGYTLKLGGAKTETKELASTSKEKWGDIKKDVRKATDEVEDFREELRKARLEYERFGGLGPPPLPPPEAQVGMPFIPRTMRVTVHRREAILSAAQAERWRSGGEQSGVSIVAYFGDVYSPVEDIEDLLKEARRMVR